jgi:hypothetical protein
MSLTPASEFAGATFTTPGGVAWRVINVADSTGQDATGRWVAGRAVTYQLQSGATGTVFVPNSLFSADSVRAAVAAEAATLDAVTKLSSGM